MRSALICVFFTLFIKEGSHVTANDFRPTPIPLDEWRPDYRLGRAGTLHEAIKTESPQTVIAVPAHYWEDALRHSVYLTLVRDKIDQLIAKGDIAATDGKRNHHVSNNVDDQDLWEKIKIAPFERIKEEEPTSYGDVTILARGRLMEESGGYRFAEDDKSQQKCDDDKCMNGVKAFWSVKRVRQRDLETSPGKYHYELTFSVMSQIPKKQKKPYEHPIRTFTVQENTNNRVVEPPQAYQKAESFSPQVSRPERAIWFHKNIVQPPQYRKRQHYSGLDRLFSSWFDDDDDDDDEPSYDLPRRYKQSSYQHSLSPYSKVGYVGSSSSEQYTQVKPLPYPYKTYTGNYQGYPVTTSQMGLPQHQYIDHDVNGWMDTQADHKTSVINNFPRTTRPAVLPTPLPPLMSSPKHLFIKNNNVAKFNTIENITNTPEITTSHKHYNKHKTGTKLSYFPDHLRPPVYNAPPGVFLTMDKKPFKPLPPLKSSGPKPLRTNRPIDFRPSPQVLDVQFSEPDPLFDTVFRPITVNYAENSNMTEKPDNTDDNEKVEKKYRKPSVSINKPPKKHDSVTLQRTTTNTPDIITVSNNIEQDDMEWADVLGIFSKTTPMDSQKEKIKISQTTPPIPTSTTVKETSGTRKVVAETAPTTTTSTTQKPKKRTRPPPKFNKSEKNKKHKRLTTTSTSTTSTTNTPLITRYTQEANEKKPTQDLTPQATSTITGTTKPHWKPSKPTSTTPFSTIGTSTTAIPKVTTKKTTTTTVSAEDEPVSSTTRSRSTNRYRQSTLLLKGTSVKHDRWSVTSSAPDKLRGSSLSSSTYTKRRKGSNFHGYVSSTPKDLEEERKTHGHIDYGTITTTPITFKIEKNVTQSVKETSNTTPAFEETNETSMNTIEDESNVLVENEESRDHNEYIFQNTSYTYNEENNEITETEETTTEKYVSTQPHVISKTKKCRKKHHNLTPKEQSTKTNLVDELTTSMTATNSPSNTPTTTLLTTPSIFEDLLNDFSFEDTDEVESPITSIPNQDKEQSQPDKKYFKASNDLTDFLGSLNNDDKYTELSDEEYEDDDETDPTFEEEDTGYDATDDSARNSQDDYQDDEKHPFTLLELMAME